MYCGRSSEDALESREILYSQESDALLPMWRGNLDIPTTAPEDASETLAMYRVANLQAELEISGNYN